MLDDDNIVEIKRLQEIRNLKADAADDKAVIITPSSPLSVAQEFLNRTHGDARRASCDIAAPSTVGTGRRGAISAKR